MINIFEVGFLVSGIILLALAAFAYIKIILETIEDGEWFFTLLFVFMGLFLISLFGDAIVN